MSGLVGLFRVLARVQFVHGSPLAHALYSRIYHRAEARAGTAS